MRALENYNKERERKLGGLVGICMRNLWIGYFVMNTFWLLMVRINDEYKSGMFLSCFGPMLITGLICLIYQKLVIMKERELSPLIAYSVLNVYVVLLLCHPSGLMILDGLVFGVIATYPVWTDQRWVNWQTISFAMMVAVRHAILYLLGCRVAGYWQIVETVGLFCIGAVIYYNVKYVHDQTMLLGDATHMDAATGLYNHEYFYEELEKRMRKFQQLPEQEREDACFCLLIADIDNFKKVNDTYGHAFGDEVLMGLAGIFKNYCGNKDFAARYGGEEFVMIVGDCQKRDALTRANTMRKKFAATVFTDASGEEHQFTVSFGVAEYNRPWNTASKFFEQADQAMYQAKNTGKNRVCSS